MMTAVTRNLLASGAVMSLVCLAPQALAAPTRLPPLPGGEDSAPAAAGDPADAPPAANSTPQELYERVRRGVVAIQAHGSSVPSALGTVLSGDGRILTSWSGLSGAQQADVRYADGTTVHAKVERTDRNLDLALLTPDPVHSKEGLVASEADPAGLDVRAMLPGHGAFLGPALAALRGPAEAHARGGEPLFQMWNVDVQGAPVAGAPVLDPAGAVVAVLVRGCRGAAGPDNGPSAPVKVCQPVVLGAPVAAIRTFLSPLVSAMNAPAAAPPATATPASTPPRPASPFLGIRVEPQVSGAVHGVRVAAVAPGGPAEEAGLKPSGDVIVAVDGQPIASGDALGAAIAKHVPGDSVKLLVYGAGTFREVAVTLRDAR
jgi:S1-C subfamily serine protease